MLDKSQVLTAISYKIMGFWYFAMATHLEKSFPWDFLIALHRVPKVILKWPKFSVQVVINWNGTSCWSFIISHFTFFYIHSFFSVLCVLNFKKCTSSHKAVVRQKRILHDRDPRTQEQYDNKIIMKIQCKVLNQYFSKYGQ